jgi:hypothetical protein
MLKSWRNWLTGTLTSASRGTRRCGAPDKRFQRWRLATMMRCCVLITAVVALANRAQAGAPPFKAGDLVILG